MQQKRIVKETCSQIKEIALRSLQGKWRTIILGMLVMSLFSYIPSVILNIIFGNTNQVRVVQFIYDLLISGPLTFGFYSLCLHLLRGEQTSPMEVFYGFEQFGKTFAINLMLTLITVLFGGAAGATVLTKLGGGYGILFALAILVIGIWIELHFMLSFYILHDQPQLDPFRILKESCRIMNGNKGKVFLLGLSFLGWVILWLIFFVIAAAIFMPVLPALMLIPLLFLGAYMSQANAAFYELTREDSAIAIEETEKAKQLESL